MAEDSKTIELIKLIKINLYINITHNNIKRNSRWKQNLMSTLFCNETGDIYEMILLVFETYKVFAISCN